MIEAAMAAIAAVFGKNKAEEQALRQKNTAERLTMPYQNIDYDAEMIIERKHQALRAAISEAAFDEAEAKKRRKYLEEETVRRNNSDTMNVVDLVSTAFAIADVFSSSDSSASDYSSSSSSGDWSGDGGGFSGGGASGDY